MAKADFRSLDDYVAAQPEASQQLLQRVRVTIAKALPGVEEAISYQMPTFKLHGSAVLSFAGWARHYALYGASGPLVAAFRRELAPYEISKGTIRFPLSRPVPVRLIARIAEFRAKAAAVRAKKKVAARKRSAPRLGVLA